MLGSPLKGVFVLNKDFKEKRSDIVTCNDMGMVLQNSKHSDLGSKQTNDAHKPTKNTRLQGDF